MSDKVKKNKLARTRVNQDAHTAQTEQAKVVPQGEQNSTKASEASLKKKAHKPKKNGQHKKKDNKSSTQKENNVSENLNGNATIEAKVDSNTENSVAVNKVVNRTESKNKRKKKDKSKKTETAEKVIKTNKIEPSVKVNKVSEISEVVEKVDIKVAKESQFKLCETKMYVTLPPCFTGDLIAGVNEFLNCYIFKYMSQFDGIVLTHNETKLLQNNGLLLYDSPFINFWITTKFLVWRPEIGSKLTGTIQVLNSEFIGLLLFGTFNAVILANEGSSTVYWVDGGIYEGEWFDKTTNQPLTISSNLSFYVKSFSPSQDTLTINGSLLEPSS